MRQEFPDLFEELIRQGDLSETDVHCTEDGFYAVTRSVADILERRGITEVPGAQGGTLACRLFFDDWYLYAVRCSEGFVYSLFKMREQEHDAELGLQADGDTPGVTVPFIEMRTEVLMTCLKKPDHENRRALNVEINRVVAYGGQNHSRVLKAYFLRSEAQASYLVAELYTGYIASLAIGGELPVPERYAAEYRKQGDCGRIPRFLEENNKAAGRVICDHEKLCIRDPDCPTEQERLAILATHTANVSVYSFAAEVQFHARFLTWWAKIPIPVVGRSPYASAIRADMSIGDDEFTGPTPYYRLNSRLVKKQWRCHHKRLKAR